VSEFFKWLSSNPEASTALIVSFGFLAISIALTYVVAFLQGREVSFWPPKIGAGANRIKGVREEKTSEGKDRAKASTLTKQKEMLARISLLERENADLKAEVTFAEQMSLPDAHALTQGIMDDIAKLFLARDNAVSNHDARKFLETQFDSQEIAYGSSSGYLRCSKMTTAVLKIVAAKPSSGKEVVDADYSVLVREDYERDFRYSHSSHIIYYLATTDKGLRIASLKSLYM
jgi:hypothetical protein